MRARVVWFTATLILIAAIAGSVSSVATVGGARGAPGERPSPCNNGRPPGFHLASTIVFTNVPGGTDSAEVYLMDPGGMNVRRVTNNTVGDGFPDLSPDGKKIVFDSIRISGQVNVSDLFLMNADGSDHTFITRGSSATWSPDCKVIAFHASASGNGTPTRTDPGAATSDSDIFVANVEDLLSGESQPRNLTTSEDKVDDDADWSPDGQQIVYTAHDLGDDPVSKSAEIYVINADGTGRVQLTHTSGPGTDDEMEAAPSWSPDGTRIAYERRIGGGTSDFEICVMNADGTDTQQLTSNSVPDLAPVWSTDGQQLLFDRPVPGEGMQLFKMNASLNPDGTLPAVTKLTPLPGRNLYAQWGELRVHDEQ